MSRVLEFVDVGVFFLEVGAIGNFRERFSRYFFREFIGVVHLSVTIVVFFEPHHGTIEIESELAKGTLVTLTFPALPPPEAGYSAE